MPNPIVTTHRGVNLELSFVQAIDRIKEGMRCDGVEAFENGRKVGYLKFDYTSRSLMTAENPTIWAYADRYGGISLADELRAPLRELDAAQLYRLLKTINLYRMASSYDLPAGASERARVLWSSINTRNEIEDLEPTDHAMLLECLAAAEKSRSVGELKARQRDFVAYASKPFVSYVNTSDNFSRGQLADNQGRGIGTVLYRAAAQWIVERKLARGLYASKLQSESAVAIWAAMARRGWVVQDGDRQYVDGGKVVDQSTK